MALFKKKEKDCSCGSKETTSCCGSKEASSSCSCEEKGTASTDTRFIVLGACCQKSADTYANVKQAVKEMGFPDEVVNIGDEMEISKYGVMQTPGLVVDGRVVSYGKLLKVDDVKKIFSKLQIS